MKKLLSFVIVFSILISVFQMVPAAKSAVTYGDLDNDAKINASDALVVLKASVNKISLTEEQKIAGDVNVDNKWNASDALLILKYAVKKIDKFPAEVSNEMTPEERYYHQRNTEYNVDFSDFEEIATFESMDDTAAMVEKLGGDPEKAPVEGYEVDARRKLIYNPLSREAKRKGELTKYNVVEKETHTIRTDNTTVIYSVPKTVTAYDVVPITYSVYTTSNQFPIHLEAVAFEEAHRTKNQSYYDLNLPGKVAVELSYEGHVTADNISGKPMLKSDPTKDVQGTAYPAYVTEDLVKSGTVKKSDHLWVKFKFTNTGDTILDGEGNGSFWFFPVFSKYEEGGWTPHSVIGAEYPMLDYVYPGESGEFWVYFGSADPGDYRMELQGKMFSEFGSEHATADQSNAKVVTSSVYEFSVTENGGLTQPFTVKNSAYGNCKRNKWLGTFEEFMSSYVSLYDVSNNSTTATTGVIYVQPAPFTEQITLKVIEGDLGNLVTSAIPVTVDSDSVKVNLNPYNTNYVITEKGTKEPMIMTQNMADMRVNVARGPNCDDIILNDLRNMQEAGINTLTTTHTYTGDYSGYFDMSMYMLDCAREMGFQLEGHARYYYRDPATISLVRKSDTSVSLGTESDMFGTKQLDAANGILARWNLIRYGDFYYYNQENKTVPIAIEDNYGWMTTILNSRIGINNSKFDRLLYKWLEKAYNNDISALNQKYNSNYSAFKDITMADQGGTPVISGHQSGLHLNDYEKTYHNWNAATIDLDIFRTTERVRNAKEFLRSMDVENAKVSLRTENNLFLAGGISPTTDNAHYRRIYYEQRMAALIPEVLAASDVIYADSSYSAWNYTPAEVYELTRQAAKTGFVTAKTPPFNRMFDDAINDSIGGIHYDDLLSLGSMQRTVTMYSVGSLFTYWKAMYEAGGIPGTMWQDYVCSLYVTTTQYKEMLFFKEKMEEMLATEEGKAWATSLPEDAESSPISDIVVGAYSFPESYIEEKIQTIPRINRIMDFCN